MHGQNHIKKVTIFRKWGKITGKDIRV